MDLDVIMSLLISPSSSFLCFCLPLVEGLKSSLSIPEAFHAKVRSCTCLESFLTVKTESWIQSESLCKSSSYTDGLSLLVPLVTILNLLLTSLIENFELSVALYFGDCCCKHVEAVATAVSIPLGFGFSITILLTVLLLLVPSDVPFITDLSFLQKKICLPSLPCVLTATSCCFEFLVFSPFSTIFLGSNLVTTCLF
uniref:Uncharacterized protein n=1 Tax=Oryza brachyantha TaxID=4533 RepID=J3LJ19_ORYBR